MIHQHMIGHKPLIVPAQKCPIPRRPAEGKCNTTHDQQDRRQGGMPKRSAGMPGSMNVRPSARPGAPGGQTNENVSTHGSSNQQSTIRDPSHV